MTSAARARLGMGLVGPGFVGAQHIDAVGRLGFVDVIAVAGSTEESARRQADALGVPKSYGSYEALARAPDVHVVHNTTPRPSFPTFENGTLAACLVDSILDSHRRGGVWTRVQLQASAGAAR